MVWLTDAVGHLSLPKLDRWPDEDRPSRMAVMIGAHAIYGTALAEAEHRLAD